MTQQRWPKMVNRNCRSEQQKIKIAEFFKDDQYPTVAVNVEDWSYLLNVCIIAKSWLSIHT